MSRDDNLKTITTLLEAEIRLQGTGATCLQGSAHMVSEWHSDFMLHSHVNVNVVQHEHAVPQTYLGSIQLPAALANCKSWLRYRNPVPGNLNPWPAALAALSSGRLQVGRSSSSYP